MKDTLKYTIPIICLVFATSCASYKKPRVEERIIRLQKEVIKPLVEIHLENAKIVLNKNDINKILNKELQSGLHNEIKIPKMKLKEYLDVSRDRYIISPDSLYELEGLTSIIDRLFRKSRANVFDNDGNRINKIMMREDFLLFGSYRRSFLLLDGREIIITSLKSGE